MPSPFPGMNPYLENSDVWPEFHTRYITTLAEALGPQLSPHFIVKIEDSLFIHEPSADERLGRIRADLAVRSAMGEKHRENVTQAVIDAPMQITVSTDMDVERQRYLKIEDRTGRQVLAIVEVLSPANKRPGADRDQYLTKRLSILNSPATLIEIDILRGGRRMPTDEPMPECDYAILVSRHENRPRAGLWTINLREPLPTIPVPLPQPVREVRLDLQAVLHLVYDRAFYKDYIYEGEPDPPLTGDGLAWAQSLAKIQAEQRS